MATKIPHNKNRLQAWSDGVFAFAGTLLVVSLSDGNTDSVLDFNWINFVGFFVSFFALIFLWKIHYDYFRRSGYVDNWIIAFNSILLFVVLYFVFPLKSLVNTSLGQKRISIEELGDLFALYGVGNLIIFLCFTLMYHRAYKHYDQLFLMSRKDLRFYVRHFSIYVFVAVLSIALAEFESLIKYGVPGYSYVLLGPLCYLNSRYYYKGEKSKVTAQS